MTNYDFGKLNDKEFEVLSVDLLSKHLGKHIERFKAGKDGGVDGRFFMSKNSEVILQCKHWFLTDMDDLLRHLKNKELPKVEKLRPASYLFITSKPLSRNDKKKIYEIFQEFMENENSIFGCEDLNSILSDYPEIEQRHYKLWLHSTEVLRLIFNAAIIGRTKAIVDRMVDKAKFYAPTDNHKKAVGILDKTNCLIVTGEPGSGKSTLAEQICLEYLSRGYEILVVSDDLKEAESAYLPGKKQIFYFDDFLGRNYLQAIEHHKDSTVVNFIERVARSKHKKFILTSRTNILNQGFSLSDFLRNSDVERNKHEIRVDKISKIERAHILYNHIWHGDLTPLYIDELYVDKRYRAIISHRNYNPRLISFLVNLGRVNSKAPSEYWGYVNSVLNNPEDVWENLFNTQIDQNSRALVILVSFNGGKILNDDLKLSYERYNTVFGQTHVNQLNSDFLSVAKLMVGALLNRNLDPQQRIYYELFNPSIGDFVVKRLATSLDLVKFLISLRTIESLKTLQDLQSNALISSQEFQNLLNGILKYVLSNKLDQTFSFQYLTRLGIHSSELLKSSNEIYEQFTLLYIEKFDHSYAYAEYDVIKLFSILLDINSDPRILELSEEFLINTISDIEPESVRQALCLARLISEEIFEEIEKSARKVVIDYWISSIQDEVCAQELYSPEDIGSISDSPHVVAEALDGWLDEYGIEFTQEEKEIILDNCDLEEVEEDIKRQYGYDYDGDDERRSYDRDGGGMSEDQLIDDLFDKQ